MTTWKDFLRNAADEAESQFGRLKNRLLNRLDAQKPYRIIYYRGFGSPTAVWLKGRVLRQHDLSTPSDNDTVWNNLLATYQRFGSSEVAEATVHVEAFGQTHAGGNRC